MPLLEPGPGTLREKILLIGGPGTGKTTAWLSIAWWAFQSGDKRKFFVLDTDDEAVLQVMSEDRYDGMVHSIDGEVVNEGGNVIIHFARSWEDYQIFSNMENFDQSIVGRAVAGDFIVLDFVSHSWAAAQDGYLQDTVKKTRDKALYEAGVAGLSGWDMFRTEFNWLAINASYFSFNKAILLKSRAHVFMTSEEEEIQDSRNMTHDAKEHVAQFGKYKAAGIQKKLPYQCRSYLRLQRLARGRVLHTLKDRARPEYTGDTIQPDFFSFYLKNAGWSLESPT